VGVPVKAGPARPSVVTIGNFDGVHVGHRQLIAEAMRAAQAAGWRSVALTFDRHPATVVRPESAPALLTDARQKLELLSSTGVDEVAVLTFDEQRAAESAEDFVLEVLVGELAARAVVVGANFRFGHRQRGDVELLAKLGGALGFEVTALDLVADEPGREPVSSSRIRSLIEAGELEHANLLLGRPYQVRAVLAPPGGSTAVGPGAAAGAVSPEAWDARRAVAPPGETCPGSLHAVVPPGICLPPPGRYEGRTGRDGTATRPGRLTLRARTFDAPAWRLGGAGERVAIELDTRLGD
jgi:phosphopantetheine adenylyltransferase